MNEKLNIKISIADRVYPLSIEPNQEEALRAAAKKIEKMITQFEQSYAVRDKQDVLAMCALQFASLTEQKQIDKSDEQLNAEKRLISLNAKLGELLEK
ncbi:cell division protein ZapA [Flavobacterium sp.]|uniref:cell division protein ZapA n=1 Tax=Flavobacterium sp. TaxID=239 RepID=UPI003529A49C